MSRSELERMTRRYASEILPIMDPPRTFRRRMFTPDAQTMAWIMDTYAMTIGHSAHGVVTGKTHLYRRFRGTRRSHRARTALRGRRSLQIEEDLASRCDRRDSGLGNAGATAARLFAEKKAKIVALSDTRGGVTNSRGIDPVKAIRYKERSGTVVGMPGASRITNDDLLTMKCDILVPAALENVITSTMPRP